MTRRRIGAGLALALLLSLGAAACSSDDTRRSAPHETTAPTTTPAPVTTAVADRPVVVVLGDSNTYDSGPEVDAAFTAAGLTADMRAIPGSGLKDNAIDWLPEAEAIVAAQPDAVVIALGTNDAASARNARDFAARADELLAALGPLRVVWVTHTEDGVVNPGSNERQVNEVIRSLPATHPNVTVLDLAPVIAQRPEVLGSDRLHYEGAGRVWFGEQLAAAAKARLTPTPTP